MKMKIPIGKVKLKIPLNAKDNITYKEFLKSRINRIYMNHMEKENADIRIHINRNKKRIVLSFEQLKDCQKDYSTHKSIEQKCWDVMTRRKLNLKTLANPSCRWCCFY